MELRLIQRIVAAAMGTIAALAGPTARAQETPVDLELVLAIDVSGSMDDDERGLQRGGYVAALRSPQVIAAIGSGVRGRIALAIVEWAGPSSQSIIVPWRLIDGRGAAEAAAAELASAPQTRIYGTSISGALAFSSGLFAANNFAGDRQVIDVSGDGANNMGPPVVPVRDLVVARGIVINGLPLTLKTGGIGGLGEGQLDIYYEDCVIGGPGSFFLSVRGPEQLADAIQRKLVLEIAGAAPAIVPASQQLAAQPVQAPRIDCLIGEKSRRQWSDENNR
jgi:hypothetical protein